ncbi:unnamed protein product [Rhizoctonia solani]|uniref:RlpA-like protein double-psi beta-barrel domain-containing protein n=1 Tax=Rhizoctonia solani TaxID=456999 RepID=A0A8H3H3P4_9AGAM|nr:unnamed protein product [Rhizoctonia solani]
MYSFTLSAFLALCVFVFSGLTTAAPVIARHGDEHAYHQGEATYYDTERSTGACGWFNHGYEHVLAISQSMWDETRDGNGRSNACGRGVTLRHNGRYVDAVVVDLCPECAHGSVDLSPSAFEALDVKDAGRIWVDWWFH